MTQARPHPTPAARAALFLGVLILAFLPGCAIRFGGSVTQDKALLALRDENHALREQLADKDRRIGELELKAQAEFASRFGAASEAQAGGGIAHAAASLPTLTTLSLDSLSGVWIADGAAEALFYIKTLDGRNRFTQATGTLVAEVLTAPSGPGEAHVFLAKAELAAHEFRDAYRSSIAGTYYKVAIPVALGGAGVGTPCTLRVTFTDALSGSAFTAEKTRPARTNERASHAGE